MLIIMLAAMFFSEPVLVLQYTGLCTCSYCHYRGIAQGIFAFPMFIVSWESYSRCPPFLCNYNGRLLTRTILVSGQLQLRTTFSRPEGVRLPGLPHQTI